MNNVFQHEVTDEDLLILNDLSYYKYCHEYLKIFGITPTLLLVDLMSKWSYFEKEGRLDKEGYFYNTHENIEKDTCLTAKQQRRAAQILQNLGVLSIKLKGVPAKNYYKINAKKLCFLVTTRYYQKSQLEKTKGNINKININKNKNKLFSKENNKVPNGTFSSITSENSSSIKLKRRKPFIPKEIIQKNIPSDIQDIFNYWKELGLRMPKKETKSYKNCIQKVKGLLSGTLFSKKYSIDIIKEVICSFSFAALDLQFEPANPIYKKKLSKITIADFILNEFNKNGNASLFKQYLKEPPKTLKQFTPVEDKYPAVSKQIKKTYQEKILGGTKTEITSSDEDCFRRASNKLIDFFKNNEDKVALNLKNSDKVNLLFDSILKTVNENQVTITPGWLCSSNTINKRLPSYCFKQSVFQEGQRWSIYDKEENYDVLTVDDYDE